MIRRLGIETGARRVAAAAVLLLIVPGSAASDDVAAERGAATESSAPADDELGDLDELDDLADLDDPGELDDLGDLDDFDAEFELEIAQVPDPWERPNRVLFRIHREAERYLLDPITRLYGLLPGLVKTGVLNVFRNADAPVILTNDLLQLRWRDAGVTVGRFALNTTVGVGGLFDAAESVGLPWHQSDFGQTLAVVGVGSGPYVVVPLIGPMTVRDGIGFGIDAAMQPLNYVLGSSSILGAVGAVDALALREAQLDSLRELEKASVDFYATLRNAYLQTRELQIAEARPDED